MIKKILIVGSSKKFITVIRTLFPEAQLTVVAWRDSVLSRSDEKSDIDLIFICGYDYKSNIYLYQKYLDVNVNAPIHLIRHYYSDHTKLIYVNTIPSHKGYTFSRYLYAKNLLAIHLQASGYQMHLLSVPTIVGPGNNIEIFGSPFSKGLFNLLIKTRLVKTVNLEELKQIVKHKIYEPYNEVLISPLIPKCLKIRRTLFIDRLLRLLLG